jgi:hypothetical protein
MGSTYRCPVPQGPHDRHSAGGGVLASVRLTANLNSLIAAAQTVEQAERAVVDGDVAHHVVDPDGVLGLDPLRASTLDEALDALRRVEPEAWFLCLPSPGLLGPLRGPVPLNRAALAQGEAVVASSGGAALVPHSVGRAVQWRVHPAERPFAPESPYDAERRLSEAILSTAQALARLDVAAGTRPRDAATPTLAPGYSNRQRVTADRAARLVAVCEAALLDDGASITAYEIERRGRELRQLLAAARDALVSAVSWCK